MENGDEKDRSSLSSRLDGIDQNLVELHTLRKRTVNIRMLLGGGILLTIVIYGIMTWRMVASFDQERFLRELQLRAVELQPLVTETFLAIGRDAAPIYAEEFKKMVKETVPLLEAKIYQEGARLGETIKGNLNSSLKSGFSRSLDKQKEALMTAFPELRDEDDFQKIAENLRVVLSSVGERVLLGKLRGPLDSLVAIDETIIGFHLKEADLSDEQLNEKLFNATLKLLAYKLDKIDWEELLLEEATKLAEQEHRSGAEK